MIADQVTVHFPSDAPTPELAAAFPRIMVDAERAVYEFVLAATEQNLPNGQPALAFYADRARAAAEQKRVPVAVGWPAYPGKIPAIGVTAGSETEDQQEDSIQGGFIGDAIAYVPDDQGQPTDEVLGTASYFSEPLYVPIAIELIHLNRDERDRLHQELRMMLLPIRTTLLERAPLIKRVRVDAEKQELAAGPESAENPQIVYISLFTVHLYSEVWMPREISGPEGIVGRIDVSVDGAIDVSATGADTGP